MIKFDSVYLQQIQNFFSVYNANFCIANNTLFVGDAIDGSYAIMRMLAKIEKEYKGEIFIDEINIKKIKDKNLPIAYVSHNFELFKNKSIFENLFYPLKLRKFNKNEAKNVIFDKFSKYFLEFLIETQNIENKPKLINNILKTKVKNLNKSQQKLLTLLRATIRKPRYILIEDFFSDLDKKYFNPAFEMIADAINNSLIIACENNDENLDCYKNFERINLRKNPAD